MNANGVKNISKHFDKYPGIIVVIVFFYVIRGTVVSAYNLAYY